MAKLNRLRKELVAMGVEQAKESNADIEYIAVQTIRAMVMAYAQILELGGATETVEYERLSAYIKGIREEETNKGVIVEDHR